MINGTPVKCLNCGKESTIRLTKGRSLKQLLCVECGNTGFKRWTEFDKEVALNKTNKTEGT